MLGGYNLYQYAPNLLRWIDPLGLNPCTLSGNTIKRADGLNLITIPSNAQIRKLLPPKGYTGNYGYEYKWQNANESSIVVRIHDIDITAPPGSNSSQGWVVRILDGKKSMDVNGNYYPPGIFKENSPYYNPSAINDVHIPINKPTSFPGVD